MHPQLPGRGRTSSVIAIGPGAHSGARQEAPQEDQEKASHADTQRHSSGHPSWGGGFRRAVGGPCSPDQAPRLWRPAGTELDVPAGDLVAAADKAHPGFWDPIRNSAAPQYSTDGHADAPRLRIVPEPAAAHSADIPVGPRLFRRHRSLAWRPRLTDRRPHKGSESTTDTLRGAGVDSRSVLVPSFAASQDQHGNCSANPLHDGERSVGRVSSARSRRSYLFGLALELSGMVTWCARVLGGTLPEAGALQRLTCLRALIPLALVQAGPHGFQAGMGLEWHSHFKQVPQDWDHLGFPHSMPFQLGLKH